MVRAGSSNTAPVRLAFAMDHALRGLQKVGSLPYHPRYVPPVPEPRPAIVSPVRPVPRAARLMVREILEDFPRLKIVASNGGGGICETISRMDYAYELGDEASDRLGFVAYTWEDMTV